MERWIYFVWFFLLVPCLAMAGTKTILANGVMVGGNTLQLGCEWDGNTKTVEVYAFYRELDGTLTMEQVTPRVIGGNDRVVLIFDDSVFVLGELKLVHIEVNYTEDAGQCLPEEN